MLMLHLFVLLCNIDRRKTISAEFCESRWNNLRDRFSKEKKKRGGCQRSGAAGGMQNYTAWECYEALSFLKDHEKHRM